MKEKQDFEEMLDSLEEIVQSLEKDNLKLDESIKKFEDGMKIAKACNKEIEEAEKKIAILINENGEVKEEDFDPQQ